MVKATLPLDHVLLFHVNKFQNIKNKKVIKRKQNILQKTTNLHMINSAEYKINTLKEQNF